MVRAKIVCLIAIALLGFSCGDSQPVVRIGSKNFTEQVILGETIAQHLENRLDVRVERNLNLGGTLLAHEALINGQIDLYPEYTGTALAAILKEPIQRGAANVLKRVRDEYERRFHITWLDPLGIDNAFAMVVSDPKLDTISGAARTGRTWSLGVGYEFEQREDGLNAVRKAYQLRVGDISTMDLGLLYKALEDEQVDMIAANATDGLLAKPEFHALRDDREVFPPYEVGIAVRDQKLSAIPGLREALAELSGKFSNEAMRQLNYSVDVEHVPVAKVASDFLKQAGLE